MEKGKWSILGDPEEWLVYHNGECLVDSELSSWDLKELADLIYDGVLPSGYRKQEQGEPYSMKRFRISEKKEIVRKLHDEGYSIRQIMLAIGYKSPASVVHHLKKSV